MVLRGTRGRGEVVDGYWIRDWGHWWPTTGTHGEALEVKEGNTTVLDATAKIMDFLGGTCCRLTLLRGMLGLMIVRRVNFAKGWLSSSSGGDTVYKRSDPRRQNQSARVSGPESRTREIFRGSSS